MLDLGRSVPPPPGTEWAKSLENLAAERLQNPTVRKKIQKIAQKAHATVYAQLTSGADFPMDKLLRYFLQEYDSRIFQHGHWSLPVSVNILEAFFRYEQKLSIFKLRKEQDHLCSFVEFMEFVTSGECPPRIEDAISCMEEGIIYSYDLLNDPGDMTFSVANSFEYGIGGVSLIRHGKEITVLLLAGQKTDLATKSQELRTGFEIVGTIPGKEEIKPDPSYEREAVPLLGNNSFWQTLAATRFDLESMTQGVRYLMQDTGDSYLTITDDSSGFIDWNGQFIKPEFEEMVKEMPDRMEPYAGLFELVKTTAYLPLYFEHFGEIITDERHTTTFGQRRNETQFFKVSKIVSPEDRALFRTLSVLDRGLSRPPDQMSYNPPDLKVENSGFWKRIDPGQIGTDKEGRPIHGRTWVSRTLSWIESSRGGGQLNIRRDSKGEKTDLTKGSGLDKYGGYIYVMRSAAHQKDIFKIGITGRTSDIRSEELSRTTGSPDKFLVVQEWKVSNAKEAERRVHERLDEYRVNPSREFFKANYKAIFKAIHDVIEELEQETH